MHNARIPAGRYFAFNGQDPTNYRIQLLPVLVAINVGEAQLVIERMQEESGLTFDETGIYDKLLGLLRCEAQAQQQLREYLQGLNYSGQEYAQPRMRHQELRMPDLEGFERCHEMQVFMASFEALGRLMLHKLRSSSLYVHGQLHYQLDHMRSNNMVLRRRDTIHDLIRQELQERSAGAQAGIG